MVTSAKYIYNEIKKNWSDTYWLKDRAIAHFGSYYRKLMPNNGAFIMDDDWDNLIILDACRYDLFREVTGVNSDFRVSRGSCTTEFLKENFANHKFDDTVYVTANPLVDMLCRNSFYKIIPVWKKCWNEKTGTVFPDKVVDYALKAEKRYSDKRLIIHFLQPHFPYIMDPEVNCHDNKHFEGIYENPLSQVATPWREVQKGNMSLERIYKAYRRNLEFVIPYAFNLAKNLSGKGVITSDHGEAFNEWAFPFPFRVLEHPPFTHIPALVKVPWLVFEDEERKKVSRGERKLNLKEQIRMLKENGKI